MRRWLILALFLIVTVGGGIAIGILTVPGAWYESLVKPAITPPNWLFGPVWTIVYILIAVSGFRTFERDKSGPGMKLWVGQLVVNFSWSPMFFIAQDPYRALVLIVLLFGLTLWYISVTWNRDRIAAWLFVPYAVWLGYATTLNTMIWLLNRNPVPEPLFGT